MEKPADVSEFDPMLFGEILESLLWVPFEFEPPKFGLSDGLAQRGIGGGPASHDWLPGLSVDDTTGKKVMLP
jgi:hypothetical protein